MKKKPFIAIVGFGLLLAACAPDGGSLQEDSASSASSSVRAEASSSAQAGAHISVGIDAGAGASAAAAAPRVVRITASNWSFSPSAIAAKRGEKVVLEITGENGIHGLAIPGLGINVRIAAGETVTVEVPTDTAGTFAFFCSIPCGSGHQDMRGSIVIS